MFGGMSIWTLELDGTPELKHQAETLLRYGGTLIQNIRCMCCIHRGPLASPKAFFIRRLDTCFKLP